jgi:aryl carrier-like protein
MTSENAMTTKVLTTTADILVLLDELFMSGNPSKQMIELLERWRASYPLDQVQKHMLYTYDVSSC